MRPKVTLPNLATTIFIIALAMAFSRVHIRIQTTMIGYELGDLKKQEALLLEEKSELQLQLAKITTPQRLKVASSLAPDTLQHAKPKR